MEHLTWRKSSRSGGDNGQCVEMACPVDRRLVRDSKNVSGPTLAFGPAAVGAFLSAIKGDRLAR
jgi:hypothetical protein